MNRISAGLLILLGLASPALAQRVQAPGVAAIACAFNTVEPTLTSGWFGYAQCNNKGELIVSLSGGGGGGAVTIADGADVAEGATTDAAATSGSTGTVSAKLRLMTTQLAAINTTLGTPFQAGGSIQAQPTPVTSGGLSVYNVQPTASDNHVVIKAGAGQVYKVEAFNNSATVNYVRFYNATTGFNGCNSATNLVWQGMIPASTSGAGLASSWDMGMTFATGISICVTSGYAQTDTTNATASALVVNVGYK